MATLAPIRAIRFNPAHIRLGGVLAPPYDVIDQSAREALYSQDLRNVVRIDSGLDYDGDSAGVNDRYTRAGAHLHSWLRLGILLADTAPSLLVTAHEFVLPDGSPRRRIGVLGRVAAREWQSAPLRPHERTLRAPKQDRLQLMRATSTQTSPVFAVWDDAPGLDELLATVIASETLMGGRTSGEFGSEKHLVWQVTAPDRIEAICAALADSRLYVADGHHRYETSVAFARERRQHAPDAADGSLDSDFCLVYLCAADDPGMAVLPTHRLVRPRQGMPSTIAELTERLAGSADVVPVDHLDEAMRAASLRRASHHAYALALPGGAALVARRREAGASPRQALDVVVLENHVLAPLGITAAAIAEGALDYTRDIAELDSTVRDGRAALGMALNGTTVSEVLAVADSGEVMPQKSTYFYPKVPTGLVLSPV